MFNAENEHKCLPFSCPPTATPACLEFWILAVFPPSYPVLLPLSAPSFPASENSCVGDGCGQDRNGAIGRGVGPETGLPSLFLHTGSYLPVSPGTYFSHSFSPPPEVGLEPPCCLPGPFLVMGCCSQTPSWRVLLAFLDVSVSGPSPLLIAPFLSCPHPSSTQLFSEFQPWPSFLFTPPLSRVIFPSPYIPGLVLPSGRSSLSLKSLMQMTPTSWISFNPPPPPGFSPTRCLGLGSHHLVPGFLLLSPSPQAPSCCQCCVLSKTQTDYASLTAGNWSLKAIQPDSPVSLGNSEGTR